MRSRDKRRVHMNKQASFLGVHSLVFHRGSPHSEGIIHITRPCATFSVLVHSYICVISSTGLAINLTAFVRTMRLVSVLIKDGKRSVSILTCRVAFATLSEVSVKFSAYT